MYKVKKKRKLVALSIAMALIVLMPSILQAQGLFGRQQNNEFNNDNQALLNRGNRSGNVELGGATQENPMEVPFGSGIGILFITGVSYVFLKRKEDEQ